jgi:hypothetical protein
MDEIAVPIVALIGFFGWAGLRVITRFLLDWRKTATSDKEVIRLREELAQVRQRLAALDEDYRQLKADHNDALLGLEASTRRLETRLDHQAGIDAPPPDPARRGMTRQV